MTDTIKHKGGIAAPELSGFSVNRKGNALLYDYENNSVVDVPADKLDDALLSGRFGLTESQLGQNYDLIGPDGKVETFAPESLSDAYASGYRYGTYKERDEASLRTLAADSPMDEWMSRQGKWLSLGIRDVTANDRQKQYRRLLHEENPNVGLAADVFGAVATSLVGPGLLIGKGATAIGAGAASKISNPLARAIVSMGTAGAVESLALETANFASEAALGNIELTADNVIAHATAAGLIGFGVGGAIGAAGRGFSKLAARAGDKGDEVASSIVNQVDETAERVAYESAEEATTESARASSRAGKSSSKSSTFKETVTETIEHEPPSNLEVLLGKPFSKEGAARRSKVFATAKEREAISREFGDAVVETAETMENLSKVKGTASREREVSKILKGQTADKARDAALKANDDIYKLIDKMRAEPDLYKREVIRTLEISADGLLERLSSPAIKTADDVFRAVDTTKRALGKNLRKFGTRANNDAVTLDSWALANSEGYGALKRHLIDADTYGHAAVRTAEYNRATNRFVSALDRMKKKFGDNVPNLSGLTERKLQSEKLGTFLRGVGSFRGESRNLIVKEFIEASDDLLGQLDETVKIGGGIDTGKARAALEKMRGARNHAEEALGYQNIVTQHSPFENFREHIGGFAGSVLSFADPRLWGQGLHIAEKGAAWAGQKLGKTTKTTTTVRETAEHAAEESFKETATESMKTSMRRMFKLEAIHKASVMAQKTINRSTARFAAKATVETGKAYESADMRQPTVNVLREVVFAFGGETKGSAQALAAERSRELDDLMNDPQKLANHVSMGLAPIEEAAQETATIMATKAANIVAFLHSKAPVNPTKSLVLQPGLKDRWVPSKAEAAKFARYMKAATDPMSVIKNLGRGTVSIEEIETIKTLYPALYESTKESIMGHIQKRKDHISYQEKFTLSLYFDIPLDTTLTNGFIQRGQQIYAPQPPAGQAGGGQSLTGIKNLEIARRMQTGTQGVEFKQ